MPSTPMEDPVRPARLATAAVVVALAAGLVQAPALAESSKPAGVAAVTTGSSVTNDDTTGPTDPPVAPTIPAPKKLAYVLGADSATITFVPPVTDAEIVNYEWSDKGGVWVALNPPVATSPVTLTNLQPGERYLVSLRAVGADGTRGTPSYAISFRIKPPPPPKPTRPVTFEADDKVLAKESGASASIISVKPGAAIKIRNVPDGAVIAVVDRNDPDFTVAVRETSKARMWVTEQLPPARRLWITVTDTTGIVVGRVNFKVGRAEKSFTVDVWPKGKNLGSGVPLIVDFGIPITNKEAVEKALVVTSDKDFGEAGWYWVDSQKAVFRPRDYWPGNAKISLDANLSSIEGAKGAYGPIVRSSFSTGDQVILDVSLTKHTMKFIRNGVQEREFPISGGKSGWRTEAGTKILTAFISPKRLYNPDPEEGWDVTVEYGIRVNDNGEYIHDAPWNYSIGYANTSHGCTNMTPSDMQWVWRNTKFGDVAEYSGSPDKIGTDDYLAGYWNFSWPEWKRGSALWQDR
jgi:lipoprotein-anchoring transpeptidase ErfK/SrfK